LHFTVNLLNETKAVFKSSELAKNKKSAIPGDYALNIEVWFWFILF